MPDCTHPIYLLLRDKEGVVHCTMCGEIVEACETCKGLLEHHTGCPEDGEATSD